MKLKRDEVIDHIHGSHFALTSCSKWDRGRKESQLMLAHANVSYVYPLVNTHRIGNISISIKIIEYSQLINKCEGPRLHTALLCIH